MAVAPQPDEVVKLVGPGSGLATVERVSFYLPSKQQWIVVVLRDDGTGTFAVTVGGKKVRRRWVEVEN